MDSMSNYSNYTYNTDFTYQLNGSTEIVKFNDLPTKFTKSYLVLFFENRGLARHEARKTAVLLLEYIYAGLITD